MPLISKVDLSSGLPGGDVGAGDRRPGESTHGPRGSGVAGAAQPAEPNDDPLLLKICGSSR